MTDDKLKANIRPPPPPDESAQCGSIYFEARDLAQDAVQDGYERRAVAEGLLDAAGHSGRQSRVHDHLRAFLGTVEYPVKKRSRKGKLRNIAGSPVK
jgi:hypothetical protein